MGIFFFFSILILIKVLTSLIACRKKVDNQNLLNLKSGMFLNKQNETTLSLRIMEVSKNHRNQVRLCDNVALLSPISFSVQRFRVQAHLPICVNVSDNLKSTIASNPILVLSKKVSKWSCHFSVSISFNFCIA
jgi:hypothetical protein